MADPVSSLQVSPDTSSTKHVVVAVIAASGLSVTGALKREPRALVRVIVKSSDGSKFIRETGVLMSRAPSWNQYFRFINLQLSSHILFEIFDQGILPPRKSLGRIEYTIKELLTLHENDNNVNMNLGATSVRISVEEESLNEAVGSALAVTEQAMEETVDPPRSDSGLTVSESIKSLVESLSKLIPVAESFAEIHPYVHAAFKIVTSIYTIVKDQLDRDLHMLTLVDTMSTLYSFVSPLEALKEESLSLFLSLETVIKKVLLQTVECLVFVEEYRAHGFGVNAIRGQFLNVDSRIKEFREAFHRLASALDTGLATQTTIVSLRQGKRVEELVLRGKLNPVDMGLATSRRKPCHTKTRLEIIQTITEWVFNASGDNTNVFWLHGVAGSGKSAISTTIANYFADHQRLGAFLFFDRRGAEADNDPYRVIRTLAFQLSQFDARIHKPVVLASDRNTQTMQLDAQFRELVQQPLLSSIGQVQEGPIVIVIDGLDECGTDERDSKYDRGPLLALLLKMAEQLPPAIRIIVTSRALPDIERCLTRIKSIRIEELEVSHHSYRDISIYVRDRLKEIAEQPDNDLTSDWPGDSKSDALVERAGGLFIWAVTACNMVEDGWPLTQPDDVLSSLIDGVEKISLEQLYDKALHSSCDRYWNMQGFRKTYSDVLGLILTVKEPVSPSTIGRFLGTSKPNTFLPLLRSVVHVKDNEPAHILHVSFREFIMDELRCGPRWYIDIAEHNDRLARACLDYLDVSLRQFCRPSIESVPKDVRVDEPAAYACSYWIIHVCQMKAGSNEFGRRLFGWLEEHFIHWLEAMSILEKSRVTSSLLDRLLAWLESMVPENNGLHELVYDASRFAAFFSDTIAKHPALVSLSALPFAPVKSRIYQKFKSDDTPTVLGGYQQWWSPALRLLQRKDTYIYSLAFSADRKRIVSCGESADWDDTTARIRIWDVLAGTETIPDREIDSRSFVTFSPDGSQVWSASATGTILVIDARNGDLESELIMRQLVSTQSAGDHSRQSSWAPLRAKEADPLTGIRPEKASTQHKSFTEPMTGTTMVVKGSEDLNNSQQDVVATEFERAAFSPDGSVVVLCSTSGTLQVVDIKGCKAMYPALEVPPLKDRSVNRMFHSIDFSPSGTFFASGSGDGSIHVWETATGRLVWARKEHTDEITVLKYASHETLLSSAEDGNILTWNLHDGNVADIHKAKVTAAEDSGYQPLAISSDNLRLAACSSDGTIRIYNVQSGQEEGPVLLGHFNPVAAAAFSCDETSSLLVSGAFRNEIHVWDVASKRTYTSNIERHERPPHRVSFSPDARKIRSWRTDAPYQTKFWDTHSGRELTMQPYDIEATFVPDSSDVVSNSGDPIVLSASDETSNSEGFDHLPNLFTSLDIDYNLSFSDDGILYNGDKEVWRIPLELEHRSYDIRGNCITLGLWNCRVVIVHLPENMLRPELQ